MSDEPYTREFYLGRAEQYPLLAEVISGERTFAGRLDGIIDDIWLDSSRNMEMYVLFMGYMIDETPLEEFSGYLDTLVALSAMEGSKNSTYAGAMRDYWELVAGKGGRESILWMNGIIYGGGTAAAAALFLLIPGGALVEGALMLLGGAGFVQGIRKGFGGLGRQLEKRDECVKTLSPVYEAARQLDSRIGTLFAADRFHEDRNLFERSYRMLDEEGRGAVASELREQLVMGAVDMGEAELDRYLGSLAVDEVAPDA